VCGLFFPGRLEQEEDITPWMQFARGGVLERQYSTVAEKKGNSDHVIR
jgi:hypothetical protein